MKIPNTYASFSKSTCILLSLIQVNTVGLSNILSIESTSKHLKQLESAEIMYTDAHNLPLCIQMHITYHCVP